MQAETAQCALAEGGVGPAARVCTSKYVEGGADAACERPCELEEAVVVVGDYGAGERASV